MTISDNGVIEIFVSTESGKSKVGATFLDNDPNVSYINRLFPEAMMDFLNTTGDPINVAACDLNTIKERIEIFKSQYIDVNGSILARMQSIVDYIENNQTIYQGIKVYI